MNCSSIPYLKSQGCSTWEHARNLLPASSPDQQQHRIGANPCRHVSPVLTKIPFACCSSRVSSCTNQQILIKNQGDTGMFQPCPHHMSHQNPQNSVLTSIARAALGLQLVAPGFTAAHPDLLPLPLPVPSLDPCAMEAQLEQTDNRGPSEGTGDRRTREDEGRRGRTGTGDRRLASTGSADELDRERPRRTNEWTGGKRRRRKRRDQPRKKMK
jgi:hypothetical protein